MIAFFENIYISENVILKMKIERGVMK